MKLWDFILETFGRWRAMPTVTWTWTFEETGYNMTKDFLNAIRVPAMHVETTYGMPWLFTASQAAHESRFGQSRLAVEGNNLFGVTADSFLKKAGVPDTLSVNEVLLWLIQHPEVQVIYMPTQEQSKIAPEKFRYWTRPEDIQTKTWNPKRKITLLTVDRPFRKYASIEESLGDWCALIIRRYPDAFDAAGRGNFEQFAEALQKGGYATDEDYAKDLVKVHNELEAIV